jgi:hypothetical protein
VAKRINDAIDRFGGFDTEKHSWIELKSAVAVTAKAIQRLRGISIRLSLVYWKKRHPEVFQFDVTLPGASKVQIAY